MAVATSSTFSAPSCERRIDSSISPAVSFAACAERCARLRTSSATTANPIPASPARAASTAAFNARMLVWNAISSIALMVFATLLPDSLIAAIEPTIWFSAAFESVTCRVVVLATNVGGVTSCIFASREKRTAGLRAHGTRQPGGGPSISASRSSRLCAGGLLRRHDMGIAATHMLKRQRRDCRAPVPTLGGRLDERSTQSHCNRQSDGHVTHAFLAMIYAF